MAPILDMLISQVTPQWTLNDDALIHVYVFFSLVSIRLGRSILRTDWRQMHPQSSLVSD